MAETADRGLGEALTAEEGITAEHGLLTGPGLGAGDDASPATG